LAKQPTMPTLIEYVCQRCGESAHRRAAIRPPSLSRARFARAASKGCESSRTAIEDVRSRNARTASREVTVAAAGVPLELGYVVRELADDLRLRDLSEIGVPERVQAELEAQPISFRSFAPARCGCPKKLFGGCAAGMAKNVARKGQSRCAAW
jgi:hypothetical protein